MALVLLFGLTAIIALFVVNDPRSLAMPAGFFIVCFRIAYRGARRASPSSAVPPSTAAGIGTHALEQDLKTVLVETKEKAAL
jgi:hypothetical protein